MTYVKPITTVWLHMGRASQPNGIIINRHSAYEMDVHYYRQDVQHTRLMTPLTLQEVSILSVQSHRLDH